MKPNGSLARRLLASVPLMGVAGLLALAAGCVRPYGVPPFTQLVAETPHGQAASFQAPDEGTVWVAGPDLPGNPRHIVFTGLVRRGETVTIDPSAQQLIVDGKPAVASIVGGDHAMYRMWFQAVRHDLLAN
ncbi:MAG TPA: hypothetical protein VN541_23605 [Tepidisphaeraceae bacterium]|nr:hypothetical protein [Tepidisphaeraceae bacterium]